MLQLSAPPLPTFLAAGEDTYTIGQSHPNRNRIGVFDLLVVTKGCLLLGEDKQHLRVEAGQSLILYPDRHHFATGPCETETHFYWFHFTTAKEWEDLSDLSSQPTYMSTAPRVDQGNAFSEPPFTIRVAKQCHILNWDKVLHLCRQILFPYHASTAWEWEQQILFQQLLQALSNQTHRAGPSPTIAVAEKAARYLRQHYTEKINYKALGEALRFHPNHVARCMIRVFGCTPLQYVNRIRIEQAKLLLISTDWSIERIAECCGFGQMAYFSRLFKKTEGMQPNQLRKKYSGQLETTERVLDAD
ncbi:helix-turn-helix transcriptional regulator [Alicyclobacillus fodiniaquatilis]|uniref:Helix-turn-helix transcriptional regulator n=1 Tax=Alicyclobacillus fodiniaquatilis TaxID=1661150 RepID=A0ABW4JN24_9BACL